METAGGVVYSLYHPLLNTKDHCEILKFFYFKIGHYEIGNVTKIWDVLIEPFILGLRAYLVFDPPQIDIILIEKKLFYFNSKT